MDKLAKTIQERYQASWDSLSAKRDLWDEVENIFSNKLADELSGTTKSQVMDQKLSTLILEREARVMATLPIGKFRGISSDDLGSSAIMNLIAEKYIVPNAKAQFPLLTKLRMMDRYSNVYGNYFALVDWDVKRNGYVGPDLWLIPIRDVFPQYGAVSVEDSDHIIIRTWRPLSFFENLPKSYKNVDEIVEKLKNRVGALDQKETTEQSIREQTQYPIKKSAKGQGFYQVLTMYEKDRWVDYVPDAKIILRDIKSPHENEELPIVCKYSIPLIDDIMGMGDMERGKTMQYTLNSLWNLYLDAIKISIFPPTILNKDNIIASTIKWGPGAKWLVRNSVGNSVQQLAINPRGIESFQSTYQVVNASILNMFGTSDTSTTKETDPGFGRTPRALQMQSARENSKDNVDRFYMEQTISEVMRKFANLWSKKQPSFLTIRMFRKEIEELAQLYPEIQEMYDPEKGKLTINKKITGSTLYDYEILSGSTYAIDQEKQQASLRDMFSILTSNMMQTQQGPIFPIIEQMRAEGKNVKLGELLIRIISGSGVLDWNKIVEDSSQQEGGDTSAEDDEAMMQHQEQFLQMLAQMQQGGINQVPSQQVVPQGPQQIGQLPVQPKNE